jgi:hypothetical protein
MNLLEKTCLYKLIGAAGSKRASSRRVASRWFAPEGGIKKVRKRQNPVKEPCVE